MQIAFGIVHWPHPQATRPIFRNEKRGKRLRLEAHNEMKCDSKFNGIKKYHHS